MSPKLEIYMPDKTGAAALRAWVCKNEGIVVSEGFTPEEHNQALRSLWEQQTGNPRVLLAQIRQRYDADEASRLDIDMRVQRIVTDAFRPYIRQYPQLLRLYEINREELSNRVFEVFEEALPTEPPSGTFVRRIHKEKEERLALTSSSRRGILPANIPAAIEYYGLLTGIQKTYEEVAEQFGTSKSVINGRVANVRTGILRDKRIQSLLSSTLF